MVSRHAYGCIYTLASIASTHTCRDRSRSRSSRNRSQDRRSVRSAGVGKKEQQSNTSSEGCRVAGACEDGSGVHYNNFTSGDKGSPVPSSKGDGGEDHQILACSDQVQAKCWLRIVNPDDPADASPVCFGERLVLQTKGDRYLAVESNGKVNCHRRGPIDPLMEWIMTDAKEPDKEGECTCLSSVIHADQLHARVHGFTLHVCMHAWFYTPCMHCGRHASMHGDVMRSRDDRDRGMTEN